MPVAGPIAFSGGARYNWVLRYISACMLCVRELLHAAMSLAHCLVIPRYRMLPQLCADLQQQHQAWPDTERAWNGMLRPEQVSLLCGAPGGTLQSPHRAAALAQHVRSAAVAYLKGAATQLWLQVMVLGDPSVAAHLVVVLIHISTVLLLAWHSRPAAHPGACRKRQGTKVAVRLLVALSQCAGYLTPATTPYHVLEVQLKDGQRLQLFASLAWLDGWLFPVPLAWQVPLGLLEYTAFTAACSWYDARAGRPAPSWQQHLLELVIVVVLPTLYVAYRTWKAGQCSHDAAVATSGPENSCVMAASTAKGSNTCSSSSSSPSDRHSDPCGARCSAYQAAVASTGNTDAARRAAGVHVGVLQSVLSPVQRPASAPASTQATFISGPTQGCIGVQAAGAAGVTTANPSPASKDMLSYKPATTRVAFYFKVKEAGFPADVQACLAVAHQGLLRPGQQQQQQLRARIVAVPGSVLLLGEVLSPTVLPTNGGFAQELYSRRSSSCVTALDGAAWTVQLPASAGVLGVVDGSGGTHSGTVGACYTDLEQLRQEVESGRLLDTVVAAASSSAGLLHANTAADAAPGQVPAPATAPAAAPASQQRSGLATGGVPALTSPAAAPPPATAGCCQQGFCAVGTWGRAVALQLHLSAGCSSAGQSNSSSSTAAYDGIRVVLAGDGSVLLDQVLPVTAVAVAADGSASVQLQLQPPPDSCSTPAAAFCLYLLPQQSASTAAASQLLLAQVTLLMLEEPLAAELVTWAHCYHLAVCQLSGLLGDLAVLLDTRQQLQEAWRSRQAAVGNLSLPDSAAASALACSHLAVTAADHLSPYLSASGLPLAADLVAGVKQQVLVGAARLQPPAAGRVGAEQLGAPAAPEGSVQHQPQPDAVTGMVPATCLGQDFRNSCPPGWQVHLLDVGSSTPPQLTPSGLVAGSQQLQLQQHASAAYSKNSSSSSVAAQTSGGATSSSKAAVAGSEIEPLFSKGIGAGGSSAGEPADAEQLRVTAAERQAAVRGGWQGALLCWRGFSCPDMEQAYLLFKADHLWVWDWVCQVYNLVVILLLTCRFLKVTGQSLWPLHRVYGVYWIAEGLVRMLVMLFTRSKWRRLRQTQILLYHVRTPPWLLWEAYMWPTPLLTSVMGDTNKMLLFMPINLFMALAVPKVMVGSWFLLASPFVLLSLVHATPNTLGFGGWVYHWRCIGGIPLLLYCLGYTLVTFVMTVCMGVVIDLWGRQAFLKSQQKEKKCQQLA